MQGEARPRRYRKRSSAAARGYDADWRRLREAHLSVFPLCAVCRETETIEPATDVDHIQPTSIAPHRRLDPSNLVSLCHSCHSRKTAMEDGGFRRKTGGTWAIWRRGSGPVGVSNASDADGITALGKELGKRLGCPVEISPLLSGLLTSCDIGARDDGFREDYGSLVLALMGSFPAVALCPP